MEKIEIMGVLFNNATLEEAADFLMGQMKSGQKTAVATPNPEIVEVARSNKKFKDELNSFELVVADGIGVIYAAKILKKPLKARIPGIDLAAEMLKRAAKENLRVFLLGASPGVAEKAAEEMRKKFGVNIVGTHDGYFKDDQIAISAVNDSGGADLVFVCLGAPKQEMFISEHKDEMNGTVFMGLGGSLDVFAGNVKRAPESFQKLGLEWLYRLFKEPKRIGRMAKLPVFLVNAMGERISGKA